VGNWRWARYCLSSRLNSAVETQLGWSSGRVRQRQSDRQDAEANIHRTMTSSVQRSLQLVTSRRLALVSTSNYDDMLDWMPQYTQPVFPIRNIAEALLKRCCIVHAVRNTLQRLAENQVR